MLFICDRNGGARARSMGGDVAAADLPSCRLSHVSSPLCPPKQHFGASHLHISRSRLAAPAEPVDGGTAWCRRAPRRLGVSPAWRCSPVNTSQQARQGRVCGEPPSGPLLQPLSPAVCSRHFAGLLCAPRARLAARPGALPRRESAGEAPHCSAVLPMAPVNCQAHPRHPRTQRPERAPPPLPFRVVGARVLAAPRPGGPRAAWQGRHSFLLFVRLASVGACPRPPARARLRLPCSSAARGGGGGWRHGRRRLPAAPPGPPRCCARLRARGRPAWRSEAQHCQTLVCRGLPCGLNTPEQHC